MTAHEAIYKGATRPAMLFGLPLVPLVVLAGSTLLLALWSAVLLSAWVAGAVVLVAAPLAGWMRHLTCRDDQRLRHLFLAGRLRLQDRNRGLWQARCYAPTVYRGARDAWLV